MMWQPGKSRESSRRRRGMPGQLARREAEREVRKSAVGFRKWTAWHGLTRKEAAGKLGICERTLADWEREWEKDRLAAEPIGRRAKRGDAETRNLLIAIFQLAGDGVGVRAFVDMFPGLSRREIEELHSRYQNLKRRRGYHLIYSLRWKKPGRVRAIDHTKPPKPIDGEYERIFLDRDLASGQQVQALPTEGEIAEETAAALEATFQVDGAPLVLKADNAFNSEEVKAVLAKWEVELLLSPPYTPSYNGSIEAGVGSIKTRAHHESARRDRPGHWTCDDAEAARLQANQCPRWWDPFAPTPDHLWNNRGSITQEERMEFRSTVSKLREEVARERGFLPGIAPGPRDQASIDREVISRALVAHGILEFRRRRIPLGIKSGSRTSVS